MSNLIGVMQGRLLPKYKGRYQAHPKDTWMDEFEIARNLGLQCIEFIFDYNDVEESPLIKDGGLEVIELITSKTNVCVKTICADYFMEFPIHSANLSIAETSLSILKKLLTSAEVIGASDIVIPCVDQSSLRINKDIEVFANRINSIIPLVEKSGINLSLETDLDPHSILSLLDRFNSDRITINYDIGNSASLGYDVGEEIEMYGNRITDIHIKDRVLNGGSVRLGKGNADFDLFFSKLKKVNYKGVFIMQAYRDDDGIEVFKEQYDWIKLKLKKYGYI